RRLRTGGLLMVISGKYLTTKCMVAPGERGASVDRGRNYREPRPPTTGEAPLPLRTRSAQASPFVVLAPPSCTQMVRGRGAHCPQGPVRWRAQQWQAICTTWI